MLNSGNQIIELLQFLYDYKMTADGVINHIVFSVEKIEKEIEKLREYGVGLYTDIPRGIFDVVS